jgi:amino acid adenylation domain-containing protein
MSEAAPRTIALTSVDFDPFAETAVSDVLPLTEPQTEIWAAVQMGRDASCAYNQCFSLTLRGALSAESMQNALRQVMDRHDALRVSIDAETQHQLISGSSQIVLPIIDLAGRSPDSRMAEIEHLLHIETTQPFDLTVGPLVRAKLIREAPDVHRLVVTAHHIVCDGWSSAVLFGDLARIYAADRHGLPAQLPVALSYRDYVARVAVRADDAQARADVGYWVQQYADSIPVLELPLDAPRPGIKTYSGARKELRLDAALYDSLKKVGAKHGCTLFVTLLAGFEALLSRLSGQEDFVVGVPMAGQTLLENGHLVGHCVNLMPLRCRIEPAARFVDHLKSVRHAFLDTQSHQQVSFGSLVRKLNVPRDPSRTPLVSVMFNIDKIGAPFDFGDLALESVESPPKRFVNFEISINVVDTGRDILIECDYNTDLLTPTTIERWLGHYRVLLRAVADNPEQRIGDLAPLTEAERQNLLIEWNDTAAEYPAGALMHQLFEAQVKRVPERTAVTVGATALSYAELDTRANRMAQALRSRGVGRGQRVGLCVERGFDMLAAVLGILKAGAAYVPLDPDYPEERLRFMAEDAQLALIVATIDLAVFFRLPRERQLLLDADAQSIASAPDTGLPIDVYTAQPEDPAYVIYTSGSTGKPKGVVVPHRAVVNFLTSMAREPGLTADDVLMAVTTLSFDIAVLELQLPLTLGATVVIASREEAMDGHALSALLEQHHATVMQATPVTWRMLLEADWKGGQDFKALVGGEAMPKDIADQLLANGVELWNMYGPTETTVWSTCARITDTSNGITIGKPIANTTAYILDAQKNLCPIGVPGEMYIGGAGVTLGYWNRPELTAERFIADPFSTTPGATLYRTGDRARWRSDGTLEHLGRLDDQVKVRGSRIEVGEIEAVLAEHPAVRGAAVHLWKVKTNDVRIVACCVPANAGALAPVSLRKHLRARLPEYMIPQYFLPLEEIPLTPNGKIDRNKLPIPVVAESRIGQHEAPSDPVETAIAEIWTNLIGPARPIGRADKFFEMGGHSLLALQALRQMENKLGVRLEFRVLFQESVADIAMRCRSKCIAAGLGQSGAASSLIFALE